MFINNIELELDNKKEFNLIINIRIIQRARNKYITIVENIEQIPNFNIKKVNKFLKKKLNCNSSIQINKDSKEKFLQFQGNKSEEIKDFLINRFDIDKDYIIIHG